MTPIGLCAMRKAAVLTHAVSSLGVMLADGESVRAVVCAHRLRVPPSVRQLGPCQFRQGVTWAATIASTRPASSTRSWSIATSAAVEVITSGEHPYVVGA